MNKILDNISKAVSYILVPPLVATCLFIIISINDELNRELELISFSIFFSLIIPLIFFFILRKLKIVNDNDASKKEERYYPYLGAIIIGIIAVSLSYSFYGINLFTSCWLIYLIVYMFLFVINFYWKISSHTSNFSITIPVLYYINDFYGYIAVILLIILGASRLKLKAHNFGQVLAGAFLGALTSMVFINLIL